MKIQNFKSWLGLGGSSKNKKTTDRLPCLKLQVLPYHEDCKGFSPYLSALATKDLDVIILKNILGNFNVDNYEDAVDSLLKNNDTTSFGPGSSLFPPAYSMLKKQYFSSKEVDSIVQKTSVNVNSMLESKVGNALQRMQKVLDDLSETNNTPLTLGSTTGFLSPYNLRLLTKDGQGIGLHTENLFLDDLHALIQSSLKENVYVEDALSYFLVLKQPESGGQLRIFTEQNPDGSDFPDSPSQNPESGTTELQIGIPVQLSVGDMVIFRSARLWHQITPVVGVSPRMTVGGFMAKTRLNDSWKTWS